MTTVKLVLLFLATALAEAWCKPAISSGSYCMGCDLGVCHPGQPVDGCQCPCGGS